VGVSSLEKADVIAGAGRATTAPLAGKLRDNRGRAAR